MASKRRTPPEPPSRQPTGPLPLVGESPVFLEAVAYARLVAKMRHAVLITGPTGSGKDVFGRLIHQASGRTGAFVAVNCSAIPDDVAEAEIFGHERGAFTGAVEARTGYVGEADQGTLFLDEVAELPLPLQKKLLRFLQDGSYRRLGGGPERISDVRIVAATNRNLPELIAAGLFREDLYFRLKMYSLVLPPLKDRGDDVVQIAQYLLDNDADLAPRQLRLAPSARVVLCNYSWPGNAREVLSVLLEASVLTQGPMIEGQHLERFLKWTRPSGGTLHDVLAHIPTSGFITAVELQAKTGLARGTLHRRLLELQKLGRVKRTGESRATRYSLVTPVSEIVRQTQLETEAARRLEVLQYLDVVGSANSQNITRIVKMSERTTSRLIHRMIEMGDLEPGGGGRYVTYRRPAPKAEGQPQGTPSRVSNSKAAPDSSSATPSEGAASVDPIVDATPTKASLAAVGSSEPTQPKLLEKRAEPTQPAPTVQVPEAPGIPESAPLDSGTSSDAEGRPTVSPRASPRRARRGGK